jgi:formate dehydrogenase major subunit
MLRLSVNGVDVEVPEGATLLTAIRAAGFDAPTLCHDERIAPSGACRICVVSVEGVPRPVASCSTPASAGAKVETHAAPVERERRTLLQLMAETYPAEAVSAQPDKDLHRLFARYGVVPEGVADPARRDASHPYIHIDMSQCITCYRCVRICEELQGQDVWQAFQRGNETEIRPATGPTLKESSCVSCGACVSTCPSGALEDHTLLQLGQPTRWTRTTCPYCGVGCELDVGSRDGVITQIKPALDSPVNKGHTCLKGRYAFGFLRAPDRVTRPLLREAGAKGGFREVSYDEAIAFVARRLREVIARHGPSSVGILGSARSTNEENYVAQKFARLVVGTNNVDCCARVCHAPTAAAMSSLLGTGAATNSYDDIERARTLLLTGSNATENHPVVGARIRQAKRRGANLIVIDPRRTELAEIADVHVQLRPGTNVPFFNAMAHVIVNEGLIDREFVADRVLDLQAFKRHLADYAPAEVEAVVGVPAALIEKAARLYAAAKPAMMLHGLGMTEHIQGTESIEILVDLALLTGNVGKPGTGVNPLRGQNNVQGSAHMGCEPHKLTGYVPIEDARGLFEAAWGRELPRDDGKTLMDMLDAAERGELKALWSMGYDIVQTNPDTRSVRRALRQLELCVVQDLFLNETAREFAHVVIPAAASFERDGTFMNAERRVSRIRTAVPPPTPDCKPDWQPLVDLARALGHGDSFRFDSAEQIWEEIRRVWPAGAGISYPRLEKHGLQWPCPSTDHPGSSVLHQLEFSASIGKRTALASIEWQPTSERADADFPFVLNTGRTLAQFNAATMTSRTRNQEIHPTDLLEIHPDDARRLGIRSGDRVRVKSRHGEAVLPAIVTDIVNPGELYTTFHDPKARVNELTGRGRDNQVSTPEYKVTAVAIAPA